MAEIKFFKVTSLPVTPVANAWYLVQNLVSIPPTISAYITDSNGVPFSLAGGGGGTGSDTYSGIAGEILGGGKVVYILGGKFYLYDASDPILADMAFGITKTAAALNAPVDIQISGVYTEIGLGLTPDLEYYAGLIGLLTSSANNIVITSIGIAIDADNIKIEIQPSIITV